MMTSTGPSAATIEYTAKKEGRRFRPAFPIDLKSFSGIATTAGQETQSAEAQQADRARLGDDSQLIDKRACIGGEVPVDVLRASEVRNAEEQVKPIGAELRVIVRMQRCRLGAARAIVEL